MLAYTASQQAKNKRPSLGRQKNVPSKRATYRPRKKEEPIVFDEAARREFLTRFRKRKQARIEKSREIAKERENEERRKTRGDVSNSSNTGCPIRLIHESRLVKHGRNKQKRMLDKKKPHTAAVVKALADQKTVKMVSCSSSRP